MDGKIPVSPGDEVEVALHRVTQEGKGVGRISAAGSLGQADRGGFTLFVRGGLPGERVRARVNRVARGYAEADMVAVVEESADRVRPLCPVFGACGGCEKLVKKYRNISIAVMIGFPLFFLVVSLLTGKWPLEFSTQFDQRRDGADRRQTCGFPSQRAP